MARGHRRVRNVLDRLHCITSWILLRPATRRMLVVGGFALVGWLLLGSAGQAHAAAAAVGHDHRPSGDTFRSGSDGVPGAAERSGGGAIGSRPYRGLTDGDGPAGGRLAHGPSADQADPAGPVDLVSPVDRPGLPANGAVAALTGRATGRSPVAVVGVRPRGIVRSVVGTAARRCVGGRPFGLRPVVTGVLPPPLRSIPGPAGSPADRAVAPASPRAAGGRSAVRHGATGGHGAVRAVTVRDEIAPYAGPGATTASDIGRSGRAHARTTPAEPAPLSGLSHRADTETGVLPSAGSTPTGGAAGHSARSEAAPRPSAARTSVLGAIPPAVRTATGEPAVTPD